VVLTLVGFGAGVFSAVGLARLLVRTDMIGLLEIAAIVFALLVGSAVLGVAQWLALRWLLLGAWAWIPATALGFAALVGCSLFGEFHSPWPLAVGVGAFLPGVVQFRVLRVQLPGSAQWFFSSAFGLLGGAFALSQLYELDDPWGWNILVGLATPLPYALMTGWALLRMAEAKQEAEKEGQRIESDG
jgi:hypothetical protein